MRIQKTKVLAGAALSVLVSALSVYPAVAGSAEKPADGQLISQMNNGEMIRGKIVSIRNDQVTLEMPNGEQKIVTIPRTERERLGLLPGMEIMAMLDSMGMNATQVSLVEPTTMTTNPNTMDTTTTTTRTTTVTATPMRDVVGQVDYCDGTNLRLRMPDGRMMMYSVTMQQCNGIRPGQTLTIRTDGTTVSSLQQPSVRALW